MISFSKFFWTFVLTSILATSAQAVMCNAGDQLYGSNNRTEYQACTTAGYCYGYDYNSQTGHYEYFYGYHSSCQGQQEKRSIDYTCRRPDGSIYTVTDSGWWSGCQVR